MSKKENFNKAMLDMFGVGKVGETEQSGLFAAAAAAKEKPAFEEKAAESDQNTYIAPGVYIEGNITSKGNIEIAGELKGDLSAGGTVIVRSNVVGDITANTLMLNDCCVTGDIKSSGEVVVTEKSIVNGNISANSIACSGKVNGDLDINENTALAGSACIVGKISTATMTVDRGAVIQGTLEMKETEWV